MAKAAMPRASLIAAASRAGIDLFGAAEPHERLLSRPIVCTPKTPAKNFSRRTVLPSSEKAMSVIPIACLCSSKHRYYSLQPPPAAKVWILMSWIRDLVLFKRVVL
jgi:hypothetical protein